MRNIKMFFLKRSIIALILSFLLVAMGSGFNGAEAIHRVLSVPSQYKTIQDAINDSYSGDIVQVSAGIYKEQIKLKAGITLRGEGYEKTVIDGEKKNGNVVVGANDAVIEGFTIRNSGLRGKSSDAMDTGIKGGHNAAMAILNNRIENNNAGILLSHGSTSLIANNIIEKNEVMGIYMLYSTPFVENNILYSNKVYGIYCASSKPTIANNTIVDNPTGIYTEVTSSVVKNNIFTGASVVGFKVVEEPAVQAGIEELVAPQLSYNIYWNNAHNKTNVKEEGKEKGAIIKDPLLVNVSKGDFRLKSGSPAVNAGDPDSKYNDADGNRADIGAFGGPYAMAAAGKGKVRDWLSYKKTREGEKFVEVDYTQTRLVGERGSKEYRDETAKMNYFGYCGPCHGQSGKGDGLLMADLEEGMRPRAHTDAEHFSQRSDEEIFNVIKFGPAEASGRLTMKESEAMPPFVGQLSDDEMMDLVKYIRVLCNCKYKE
jgi:parallel beta-helix repeat protein